jgi:hypothetical protein
MVSAYSHVQEKAATNFPPKGNYRMALQTSHSIYAVCTWLDVSKRDSLIESKYLANSLTEKGSSSEDKNMLSVQETSPLLSNLTAHHLVHNSLVLPEILFSLSSNLKLSSLLPQGIPCGELTSSNPNKSLLELHMRTIPLDLFPFLNLFALRIIGEKQTM